MKTKITAKLFAGVLAACTLTLGANAAFAKTNTYTDGQFKDVKTDAWYAKEVASAYELGFMNGTSTDVFSPEGNVTVAQGITMAVRVHANFNGKEAPANSTSGNWYDSFVKYAVDNGIIKADKFDSYTRNITRAEMATLFADAVPASEFKAINSVEHIPDVIESNDYASKILMLYNAGVVMGSDAYGTFNPDADIKRSEAAAIINRVAIPENRLQKTLKEYNLRDAYQFLYFDGTFNNNLSAHDSTLRENIDSGWRIDNRGGAPRTSIEDTVSGVKDISETQGSALIRDFNKISGDVVSVEFSILAVGNDGYFEFRDDKGNPTYSIKAIDGKWSILGKDGKHTALADLHIGEFDNFRMVLDLISGKSETYVNNVYCGEHELLSDNLYNFRLAFDEKETGSMLPGRINMTANYGVYEIFDTFGVEEVYGWKKTGDAKVEDGELILSGKTELTKNFDAIDAKYIAEMLAIFPSEEDASFKIMSGSTNAVKLESKGGKLYANGTEVYDFTKNMWYRLRVEANPSTGKAEIIVNGRTMGFVTLNTTNPVDTITFASENGNAKFDDIKVYTNVDHYDYVAEPEAKASFDDYIVAMNICSLWRNNGTHYGWACITPYDANKPVLGYYDEGNPETADWEIKYMVEHGIDVQALCWYSDASNGPLKNPRYNYQLHDGIQQAKYEDYMKYCLIWEVSNSDKANSDQFRNYVIPYWFENYFLDENYFTLENKLVLHMFGGQQLGTGNYFGSPANAKKELEYLNDVAKSYGFDGVLLFSNGELKDLEALGIDGFAAYHWNIQGYQYQVNVNNNVNNANSGTSVYNIPTISVGYTDFAWRGAKAPLMSVEDHIKSLEWVKNEYLPKYAKKGTWQEKLIWLSTWNEYGEGTYMSPSGLNEFGYLDSVRKVLTNLGDEHTDYVPTEAQAERIQRLYPQYVRLLRRQGDYENAVIKAQNEYDVVKSITFKEGSVSAINKIGNVEYKDGVFSGKSTATDFNFYVNEAAGVDVTGTAGIRINLAVPAGNTIQIFFATEAQPNLGESKSIQIKSTSSEMTTYFFNFRGKTLDWTGTLKTLRIDPANGENIEFKLGSIEFVKQREVSAEEKELLEYELYVNTNKIESVITAEKSSAGILFPFDPETSVDHIMHTLMTWNHDEKILTLEANNHKAVFTVGKDTYTADGKEKKLGYTLYQVDGLPMMSYKVIADALGFTYKEDGKKISVETPEVGIYKDDTYNVEGNWQFNSFDTEGWASANMTFIANGEYLRCDNTKIDNRDPNMTASQRLGFAAAKYSAIEVKVRYKYDTPTPQQMTFYFTTSVDTKADENKTVRASLKSTDSKGEWEVYTFDLTNRPTWLGEIKTLRFDPFNASGYMEVDYIKLVANPNYNPEEDTAEIGIINGDAETEKVITFTSPTAKITIVEDETKKGNHVYQFTGPDRKAWTYAVHSYPFVAGKRYKISFDARAVSDSKGDKVRMNLAVNIQYPSETGNDHHAGSVWLEADGKWVHYEGVYTVQPMTEVGKASFSCYITPPSDEVSGIFQLDNVVVEEMN